MANIERAFAILEILVGEREGARITDIANALDLNRAIPHRLLSELSDLGYVTQDSATERYQATFKLGSLGIRQLETAGIPRWAQSELTALAAASRELVRLAVASETTLRFIAQAQGADSSLIIDSPMLGDIPLHATATGKAWLSTLTDDEIVSALDSRDLLAYTPETKTSPVQILREIGVARDTGFAVTYEEMEAGINAIAAPVCPPDMDSRAVGTVSIAGPSVRLPPEKLESFGALVISTASTLAGQWHVHEYLDRLTTPASGS